MPQAGINPLRPQRFPHRTEAGILRPGIGAGVLTSLVGTGKMRKYPGGPQVFGTVHHSDIGQRVGGKADAVHAGIHLDVHLHRDAGLCRTLGQRTGIFRGIHRLGEPLFRKLRRIFAGGHAEDQDRPGDAVPPQDGGLLNVGNGEPVRPALLHIRREHRIAVSVGVGLDHRHNPAVRPQHGTHRSHIVPQRLHVDLRPAAPEKSRHAGSPHSIKNAVPRRLPVPRHRNIFF